jgi:predicted DsbA family dithiol-disulfide isomerase
VTGFTAAFDTCLTSKKFAAQIKADQAEDRKPVISGTPNFVLALTDSKHPGIVHFTKFIRGAKRHTTFAAAIDELLKSAEGAE